MKFESNQDIIGFQICGEIVTVGGSTLHLTANILGLFPVELIIFDRRGLARGCPKTAWLLTK